MGLSLARASRETKYQEYHRVVLHAVLPEQHVILQFFSSVKQPLLVGTKSCLFFQLLFYFGYLGVLCKTIGEVYSLELRHTTH